MGKRIMKCTKMNNSPKLAFVLIRITLANGRKYGNEMVF